MALVRSMAEASSVTRTASTARAGGARPRIARAARRRIETSWSVRKRLGLSPATKLGRASQAVPSAATLAKARPRRAQNELWAGSGRRDGPARRAEAAAGLGLADEGLTRRGGRRCARAAGAL